MWGRSIPGRSRPAGRPKKVLAECDEADEDVCLSVDYLQCQVEHSANQDRVLEVLQHRQRFEREFDDVRYLVHELRDSLMKNIRFGKRTEEFDQILKQLTSLMTLANQMGGGQPTINNFAGIERAFSPRCDSCPDSCRSAFRKVQSFLRKLIKACEKTQTNSDAKR